MPSIYSEVETLNLKRGDASLELMDITKGGKVAVSLEVERDGEVSSIFLNEDDVERVRAWCDEVLNAATVQMVGEGI
jgi:hypothetical protein